MSQPFAIRLAEKAVREFFTRWSAGLQPSILIETHANGEILVSSRVSAPHPIAIRLNKMMTNSLTMDTASIALPQALLASAVVNDVPMHVQQLPMLLHLAGILMQLL